MVPVSFTEDSLADTEALMVTVEKLRHRARMKADGGACYAYGKPCPYLKNRCDETETISVEEFNALTNAPISPTSAKRIFTCPRKNFLYQLDKLREKPDTEGEKFKTGVNEKAVFGNAFHSGIGEVYKQLSKR